MADFIRVGSRFVNLDRVHDALHDPQRGTVTLALIGGESVPVHGADAQALLAKLGAAAPAPAAGPSAPPPAAPVPVKG